MKSNTYTKSVLAIAALSTQQVLAQTPLGNEQGQVCGFTLSVDNNAIVRTNDWTLAVNNGDAALSQSNFWITAADIARLYGSNGNRCEFDRKCSFPPSLHSVLLLLIRSILPHKT